MEVQPYRNIELGCDRSVLENILFQLTDAFNIRIVWDQDTAIVTSALAVGGALLGGLVGGRLGATLGASIGGAAGFGVSNTVTLREIWSVVKEKLQIVLFIIYNRLRQFDAIDCIAASRMLMACASSKTELVLTILDLLTSTLGRTVLSSLTAA